MNTPNGITERLQAVADASLRDVIEQPFAPVRRLLVDGSRHLASLPVFNSKDIALVEYWRALEVLKECAFVMNQKPNQEKHITEFLQKVNSLDAQIAGLRDSIPQ